MDRPISRGTVVAEAPAGAPAGAKVPLCVDLDGTLIRTDMLWESVMLWMKRSPWAVFQIAGWVARGKTTLKEELAKRVMPDASTLPYREEVLGFLTQEHEAGRRIVLATASHEKYAAAVAEHLGVFDDVLATTATFNCKGPKKLAAIQGLVGAEFDYMGDSHADVPLFKAARSAYVVNAPGGVIRKMGAAFSASRQFEDSPDVLGAWIKALRPMQWAKNLLVFVPLLTAHLVTRWQPAAHAVVAFIVFCLGASAVYLLNDVVDIDSDRQHPKKRYRPLASGRLLIPQALAMCLVLIAGSIALSVALLPRMFLLVLGVYLVTTTLYTFYLKRRLLLDVITLAGLYTLRIVGGGAAVEVEVTQWLLAFSMFFFLSLAYLKRYSELLIMTDRQQRELRGRSYITDDIALVETVGPASGYMAVLVFGLYINQSDVAKTLYRHPSVLWALCPILLYWITRLWFLARRRHFADDPIAFAIRDRVSLAAGVLALLVGLVASLPWSF